MADWDKDSQQLRQNLNNVLDEIILAAGHRDLPAVASAKHWHSLLMQGLTVPNTRFVAAFREPGLESVQVRVGGHYGVAASDVAAELAADFGNKLQTITRELDAMLPSGRESNADQLAAVLDVCAWVHAEWVRIHPFANGNGRIARLWANFVAMRYGLPPFVRLRPRPNDGYADAGAKAMQGDWKPTAVLFRRMLNALLDEQ